MNLSILILSSLVLFYWIDVVLCDDDCKRNFGGSPNLNARADREYYIACVEVEWDYAPSMYNLVTGTKITSRSPESAWLYRNRTRIGRKYIKSVYRAYTNACFNQLVYPEKKWFHLGAIGPAIRAIVGETIKIFYKNTCSFPNSMHAHGMEYDKTSEGAPYDDGSTGGDVVYPSKSWVYIWDAREGTVDDTVSSQMWLYHSHVDEVKDVHSGLVGPIIVTQPGMNRNYYDLMPRDISREFVTFFILFNETESHYFQTNLNRYLDYDDVRRYYLLGDGDFVESNNMHTINGRMFGNTERLSTIGGEKVRWYTASFGNELDGPHSPHWHGNTGKDSYGHNLDTLVLIPGTTGDITMKIDAFGKWLYHCHVFDHIEAGMITTYTAERFEGELEEKEFERTDTREDYPKYETVRETENNNQYTGWAR